MLQRWVGRYELIHRLAHGGMATVYLGRAKGKAGFEKIVAVKVIHPHLASEAEFVGMFLDEARIAARIHHPHVVEILDLGEHEGVYYMVMEFIEGENLAALIRALDGEALPVGVILQIAADTLAGLSAAHNLRDADGETYNLVHRDVSPHNILINLDGWAKVADFGIMKAAGKASSTRTGELRGKLAYMSPEQARGDTTVDRRTDLFALGVIIWELLTGKRLFACASEAATLEKVVACEIPPLDEGLELDAQLRAGLERLLARALAPSPAQRHESAAAMLTEIKALRRLVDDDSEPRRFLGASMQRFFQRRVEYARATLRRTGEYDALVSGARAWPDPTRALGRPPTESNPALDSPLTPIGLAGPPTGSHPGLAALAQSPDTATYPSMSAPRSVAQWSLLLLLPMLGAVIAVALMLWLGPNRDPANAQAVDEVRAPEDANTNPDNASARRPPSELAATEFAPRDERPAGTIRWYVTSTPSDAAVFINGERAHDTTPVRVFVPIAEEPVDVRIELAGYETLDFSLLPTSDQNLIQQLRPLPAVADSPPKGSNKKRKPPKVAGNPPGKDPAHSDDKKPFVPVPDSLRNP